MKPKVVNGPNAGLIAFLYELLRDFLPVGDVEKVARNSEGQSEYSLCNGHLAEYAEEVAKRLLTVHAVDFPIACKFCHQDVTGKPRYQHDKDWVCVECSKNMGVSNRK
jgi:hypothetical protein